MQEVARELRKYDWQNFKNGDLKRMFKKMTDLGYAALPEAKFTELLDAISSMSENYATAKVCDYKNREKCDLALEPELTEIFATSRDPEELKYYWTQWYDKAGTPTREAFDKYIKLSNEAAKLNSKIGVSQTPDSQKSSITSFQISHPVRKPGWTRTRTKPSNSKRTPPLSRSVPCTSRSTRTSGTSCASVTVRMSFRKRDPFRCTCWEICGPRRGITWRTLRRRTPTVS